MNSPLRTCAVRSAVVLVSVLLVSCVTLDQDSSGGDPNVITRSDIEEVGEISNTYNLVQRLKPQWLRKRGRNSIQQPGDIMVYVDDAHYGNPESLRQIDVIDVQRITFLPADQATMRYGGGHDNGAILVNMRGE